MTGEHPETAELTQDERRAIRELRRLASKWPQSLTLFASGVLTVRKPNGGFPGAHTVVADIFGIPNDGGDGGDIA